VARLRCQAVWGDGLKRPEIEFEAAFSHYFDLKLCLAGLEGIHAAGDGLPAPNEGFNYGSVEEEAQVAIRQR